MADKRDYYEVLGIDRNADEARIKSAYRKKAKKYHPDMNPGDAEAEKKFKEVNEAYEVLSDPDKKRRYDAYGHAGVDPNYNAGGFGGGFSGGGFSGGGVDFGDIFENFFGGGFGGFGGNTRRADPNAPRRGADVRVGVSISFMEAAHGVTKTVSFSRQEECPDCHGTGSRDGKVTVCPHCHGAGYVTQTQRTPFGVIQNTVPCPHCGGKGKIVSDPCRKCGGSGKVSVTVKKEVSIPAGINDDQNLAMRGQGDAGSNGGPAGDAIIIVTVRPDPILTRDGYDVYVNVPITYCQAVLGAEVVVPTVDGKVRYNVPEGTQSGTRFRLRGKGIQYLGGRGKGDEYVTVVVEIPKKITREQKKALEAFDATLKDDNYEQRKGFFRTIKDLFG